MKMGYFAALTAALVAGSAQAADLELALSGDTASIEVLTDSESIGVGGADLSFGGFFNNDDDYMAEVGLLVEGRPAGDQPLSFGLGGKVLLGSIDTPDAGFSAIALGGKVRYHIPSNTPMAFGADLFYAPDITTFSDAEGVTDMRVRFEVDVLPAATAFLGYRKLSADLGSSDYDLDDNVHIGIRFQF